jgi:RNA polymerase sigma-70 factor (ECF subfamily)
MRNARPAQSDGSEDANLPFVSAASIIEQRARLVRLCKRLTGNAAVAEDLVQEALLVAWRQACQGRAPQDWQPYLVGIARRMCLNWRSRTSQRVNLLPLSDWSDETLSIGAAQQTAPDPDPLASLLHAERAQIIDRALAEIDPDARTLLIAYYLDEHPLSEIAGALGLSENATAVRMHRSREALARALAGKLRADAAAHGLLTSDTAAGWEATRLWCPRCGRVRLQGRFTTAADAPTGGRYEYVLRCADCDRHGGPPLGFTSAALPMEGAAVLDGVSGYRAAFKRLHRWWEGYVEAGMAARRTDCVHCGRPTPVLTAWPGPNGVVAPGFFTHCGPCGGVFFIAPGGLLFHAAPMRAFWQAHPHVHFLPERRVRCEGREAALVGFEDRQSNARLEMVIALDDLRPLRVLETK